MGIDLNKLHQTFVDRALWTNSVIGDGVSTRLGILEETITNINLIDVSMKCKDYIFTKVFSHKEEGNDSGADWLWCIGQPGAWFSLLVQAKLVNPFTSTCYYLDYKSGRQRHNLINYARKNNFYPTYCIYSYIRESFTPVSRLAQCLSSLNNIEWACSLLTPKHVRLLLKEGRKKQKDLLRFGIPWSYPFKYAAEDHEGGQILLAKSIAQGLKKVTTEIKQLENGGENEIPKQRGSSNNKKKATQTIKNTKWEDPDPTLLIMPKLPKIATMAIQDKILQSDYQVAGVSIISAVPINEILLPRHKFPELSEGSEQVPLPEYINKASKRGISDQ